MPPTCPYGSCTMMNLCKGDHCVRQALEDDGYVRTERGTIEKAIDQPAKVKNDGEPIPLHIFKF